MLHVDTATEFPLSIWTAFLDMKQDIGMFPQMHVSMVYSHLSRGSGQMLDL